MRANLPAVPIALGIDAGATRVRSVAVDGSGRTVASSVVEVARHRPRPGWFEYDPGAIWDAVQATMAGARAAAGDPAVAAIGVATQRETVVAWDRNTGAPLHPAVAGPDRRSVARADRLEAAGHQLRVQEITGLPLDPTFSATKMAWLLADGGVRPGPRLALSTLDSWLLWKLTEGEVFATDPSSASRTLLYDLRYGVWSTELCDLFRVPKAALPEVRRSSGRLGTTAEGIPVSATVGDAQAALFAQACVHPGLAGASYGPASSVLVNVGVACPAPVDGLLATVAWSLPGDQPVFAREGALAAGAIEWLRDGLGIVDSVAGAGRLAESLRDAQGVVFVPAFSGLGSPWSDPRARGTVVGLTRGSGRAQLARAAIEATAYQTRDVVDAMAGAVTELRVGGDAADLDVLLQIQADQLRVPVVRPAVTATGAVGAALLAGLGEGMWSSVDEVAALWRPGTVFQPRAPQSVVDDRHATWRRAVDRSRRWAGSAG